MVSAGIEGGGSSFGICKKGTSTNTVHLSIPLG